MLILITGKSINVIPIWKKIGLNKGTDKFIIVFNKKMMLKEKIKIIVKEIHSSWLFLLFLFKITYSVKYLNKRRKIEVVPRLFPIIISYNKPTKNKITLDKFLFNLEIYKYIIIEIKLGVDISKTEKRLKDVWKFNIQNKKTKINILLENL